ncbi:MAG: hypothetical protein NVS3B21_08930 [Acidimicrobiales bacterium]
MSALLGSVGVSGTCAATTGTPLAWISVTLALATLVAYSCILFRIERGAAEREMSLAFEPLPLNGPLACWPPVDLLRSGDGGQLRAPSGRSDDRRAPLLDRWALSHFVWASLAGLLLELVVVLTDLVLGNPATPGGRRRNWLDRSERLQRYLRLQSHRAFSASATATAGVVVVGTMSAPSTAAFASTPAAATSTNPALVVGVTTRPGVSTQADGRPDLTFTTYRVAAGDTLSEIAARHDASAATVAALNALNEPDRIWPGQLLRLPSESSMRRPSPVAGYVVAAGDTLSSIARRLGTTVAALATGNRIADPDLIQAGQVLRLPTGGDPVLAHPASAPPHAVAPAPTHPATPAPPHAVSPAPTHRGTPAPPHAVSPAPTHPGTPAPPHAGSPAPTHPAPPTPPKAPPKVAAPPSMAPPPSPVVFIRAPQPSPPPPPPPVSSPLPLGYLRDGFVDQGVDYSAPGGTPLYAIGPGVITAEGINGFGPWAPVLHITGGPLAGRDVYYGHAGPDLVNVGDTVQQGQQISSVGDGIVGYSTGPHLEIGFYPPGGSGAGIEMLWVLQQLSAT